MLDFSCFHKIKIKAGFPTFTFKIIPYFKELSGLIFLFYFFPVSTEKYTKFMTHSFLIKRVL